MENTVKEQITKSVNEWIDENNPERSGKKLADKSGVNMAYVSQIRNGKYEHNGSVIKDYTFIKIAEAIGFLLPDFALHFETEAFKLLQRVCEKAQNGHKIVTLDSLESGAGKTYGLEWYKNNADKVAYAKCTSTMGAKDLLDEILLRLGYSSKDFPKSTKAKMDMIREVVTKSKGWLLIIDECDDIKMGLFKLIKEIIDFTRTKCGLIVCGMGVVAKINRLAEKRREGFPQLKRRLLANKVMMPSVSKTNMEILLKESGITNSSAIKWFQDNVEDMQMLAEYIKDALEVAKRENVTIDKDFLNSLFKSL